MANQLWSDLLIGAGNQLWSDLDSAPGIVSPAPALLTLLGNVPAAAQQVSVFRTPAPATLTLAGIAPGAPVVLTPSPAALSASGLVPSKQLILTITPALAPPLETPPQDFAPTLITIWMAQPGVGSVQLNTLPINVTQGGNIGFISPGVGNVTFGSFPFTLLFGSQIDGAFLSISGLAPLIVGTSNIVTPGPAELQLNRLAPALALPFVWVDDAPAPSRTWITDAAA